MTALTYTDRYENPLPALDVDNDSLVIETKDRFEGRFRIKNTGGGLLKGRVLSRCPGLTFSPDEFEGNNQTVSYSFNSAGLKIGETVDSVFYITSNGGEKEIPVSAKLTKMSIDTPDGHKIANIRDFYDYSLTHPTQARRLFTDSEFYMLLLATGYAYMEVYESLHKDANRERAMDNFFVLSGLKGRTTLEIKTHRIELTQKPGLNEMLYGQFQVKKSDGGYVDAPVTALSSSPWLTLSSGKLAAADFNEGHIATVNFSIDPTRLKNTYAREVVTVGTEAAPDGANVIEIVYRSLPPVALSLNRETYRYDDRGIIKVVNNTGATMQVEAFCPESYIRFAAKRFAVGAYGEIPFEVKLSAFLSAQLFFRKLPYMKTGIEIKATVPGRAYKETLPIVIGEW